MLMDLGVSSMQVGGGDSGNEEGQGWATAAAPGRRRSAPGLLAVNAV
jgi:hypothetical protein